MDEKLEEFGKDNEELNLDKKGNIIIYYFQKNKLLLLLLILIISIIIIIIILSIFISKSKDKNKNEYSIKAIYNTDLNNQTINLINLPLNNIDEMILENTKIKISNNYTFKSAGNHTIYILLKKTNSLNYIFNGIKNMISI